MDQQKRHWQRIDDIADQQSVKSIDIKQLSDQIVFVNETPALPKE